VSSRPYWKGYLKLSLVSYPISLHAACSSSERVSFRQINRKTGDRLPYLQADRRPLNRIGRRRDKGDK
jgi:DNA end-binding protein Ku